MVESGAYARLACVRELFASMLALALVAGITTGHISATCAWADEGSDGHAGLEADDGQDKNDLNARDDVSEMPSEPTDDADAGQPSRDERQVIEALEARCVMLDKGRRALDAAKAAFDAVRAVAAHGIAARGAIGEVDEGTEARVARLERSRKETLALLDAVQDEMMRSGDHDALAIVAGTATPGDLGRRQDMLERLLVASGKRMRETLREERRLRASAVIDAVDDSRVRSDRQFLVCPVNEAAYEVERCCAQLRQCVADMRQAIPDAQEGSASLLAVRQAALDAIDSASSSVTGAESSVGSWYDELDARAGVSDAISFGEGMNFAISEEEFVEIWGRAIDEYFESCAKTAGSMPLQGYGRTMAISAYRHKVDPRLCAAVGIVESSGGQSCIRPCNAWGWGAADSDPYGLAAEWGSFEEAIEAWHEGMATSGSGLATAPTVSALGAIYCSSPSWSMTVIDQMELVSSFA